MLERVEQIVPVDVTDALSKGTVLGYDATNHRYAPLSDSITEPVGVLLEDVEAGQDPATAKVLFFGVIYEDDLATTPDEDMKANLRKVGIFVVKKINA